MPRDLKYAPMERCENARKRY